MAKGARSSVRKTNNRALKSRVFGPVEDARTARLSQKLLELASQPKTARTESEQIGMASATPSILVACTQSNTPFTESKDEDVNEKETTGTDGGLSSSISIPASLTALEPSQHYPTPPPTPEATPEPTNTTSDTTNATSETISSGTVSASEQRPADVQLFYHFLGLSNEITGFDSNGDLELHFGSDGDLELGCGSAASTGTEWED